MNYHPRLLETTNEGYVKGDILKVMNTVYVNDRHLLEGDDRITHKLIQEALTQPVIEPWSTIYHTQGGKTKASNDALWRWANRTDVSGEPHIIGPDMETGEIIQCVPFNHVAHSNLAANYFKRNGKMVGAVSWETQDNGHATLNQTPWTLPQIGTMVAGTVAYHFTYRIACTQTTDWDDQGISQHNAFPQWSATAHSCPGTARTRQMDAIRNAVATQLANIYQACGESCPG